MKSAHYCFFALVISVANARQFYENDPNNPIREIHTTYGQADHERVTYIRAVITPHHINNGDRINFPTTGHLGTYYQEAMAPGDERGHLVASQFSGPAVWYNLSPQNARVNRNAGYQSITTDWYNTECEVRRFLDQGGNRSVIWEVDMNYVRDSNRPDTYHLRVAFMEGNRNAYGIDTTIRNPFLREDSTFWICRECRSSRHDNYGCSRG